MSIIPKPDMSYGVWAENGNIEIPSSEKVEEGWVLEKPYNETMNWLQNRQDRMLQYLNQRGVVEWDTRTEYPVGAIISRDSTLFKAKIQNKDKDPLLNIAIWEKAFVDYKDFKEFSDRIDDIEDVDGYLTYYVRKSAPVMDAKALGVSYADLTGKGEYGFVGATPTVLNNGNLVAEFSGGTKPKDVVTHEQLKQLLQSYRIGDIYITTNSNDPNSILGYGSWERFGQGQAIVGFSASVSNNTPQWVKTVGSEFGSYTHKLTVSEMPNHNHPIMDGDGVAGFGGKVDTGNVSSYHEVSTIGGRGGDQPHNNVQPSVVVFLWKRTS